jgi:hypothetical protein
MDILRDWREDDEGRDCSEMVVVTVVVTVVVVVVVVASVAAVRTALEPSL